MREVKNKAVLFLKERIGQAITPITVEVFNEYLECFINDREFEERMKN